MTRYTIGPNRTFTLTPAPEKIKALSATKPLRGQAVNFTLTGGIREQTVTHLLRTISINLLLPKRDTIRRRVVQEEGASPSLKRGG